MEEKLEKVEKEMERVTKRHCSAQKETVQHLSKLIHSISSCRAALEASPADSNVAAPLATLEAAVKTQSDRVQKSFCDQHNGIAKLSKAVDAAFPPPVAKLCKPDAFDGMDVALNSAIVEHLQRTGRLQIAHTLMKEAGLQQESFKVERFRELNVVMSELRQQKTSSALAWVRKHASDTHHGAALEFRLHRLEIAKVLANGKGKAVLEYVRKHMRKFLEKPGYLKEIKHIMGSMLYVNKILSSRYADILDPAHWREAMELFSREWCLLLGLPHVCPLETSASVGCAALPKLARVAAVLQQANRDDAWMNADEMPVEIDLSKEQKYHTSFACPVSREVATEANPPMRLLCGHVICRESALKMVKRNSRKFKCAYCPREMSLTELTEIHF
eukprot:m.67072 g.67072  ORF g.67072 m.67072 type:complete len:388 (-) comp16603_c3_seq1:89-1252(-)